MKSKLNITKINDIQYRTNKEDANKNAYLSNFFNKLQNVYSSTTNATYITTETLAGFSDLTEATQCKQVTCNNSKNGNVALQDYNNNLACNYFNAEEEKILINESEDSLKMQSQSQFNEKSSPMLHENMMSNNSIMRHDDLLINSEMNITMEDCFEVEKNNETIPHVKESLINNLKPVISNKSVSNTNSRVPPSSSLLKKSLVNNMPTKSNLLKSKQAGKLNSSLVKTNSHKKLPLPACTKPKVNIIASKGRPSSNGPMTKSLKKVPSINALPVNKPLPKYTTSILLQNSNSNDLLKDLEDIFGKKLENFDEESFEQKNIINRHNMKSDNMNLKATLKQFEAVNKHTISKHARSNSITLLPMGNLPPKYKK